MEQAQQQAAEQQAKAAEVQMLMQEEAGLAQQEAEMYDKAMQMAVDSDKTNAKTALPVISNAAKAMSEVPEPQV
jgi:hypothetical protein